MYKSFLILCYSDVCFFTGSNLEALIIKKDLKGFIFNDYLNHGKLTIAHVSNDFF